MIDSYGCVVAEPAIQTNPDRHMYGVYGIALQSDIPLPLPRYEHRELARIELRLASAAFFDEATRDIPIEQLCGSFYHLGRLTDRSIYARWPSVGEFLVSNDGRLIYCRQFDTSSTESFCVYLLGRALSIALVKSGFEPLHATTVVLDNKAIVFMGQSGYGKSSLAASFLAAGYQILTDDLLLLQPTPSGVVAYPGPPRIKLFPRPARRFLGSAAAGVPMNRDTEKLILPLADSHSHSAAVPVTAIYSLVSPREVFRKQRIHIEPLAPRQAFLELLKNTFNFYVVEPRRLERQMNEAVRLVSLLPIRKLSFARIWKQLPDVREAIIADSCRLSSTEAPCGY